MAIIPHDQLHHHGKEGLLAFIAFLEHLLVHKYPTGRVVLALDNARYHGVLRHWQP